MESNESFQYTYSAKEQDEIKTIRSKYSPPEETQDKLSRLRKLDEGVTKKASAAALVLGILGSLVLGSGMSLFMTDLGKALFPDSGLAMPLGILIGIVGILLICIAYPAYLQVVKKERKKIAPEILRLTDELMK